MNLNSSRRTAGEENATGRLRGPRHAQAVEQHQGHYVLQCTSPWHLHGRVLRQCQISPFPLDRSQGTLQG